MNMRDIRTSSPVNTLTGTNSRSRLGVTKGFCKIAVWHTLLKKIIFSVFLCNCATSCLKTSYRQEKKKTFSTFLFQKHVKPQFCRTHGAKGAR